MLRELVIENIAVIQRAELRFEPGFSVLSGETGAGKSIIIDALSAILGGRVSRELMERPSPVPRTPLESTPGCRRPGQRPGRQCGYAVLPRHLRCHRRD